jgi:predicted anti-sigma-YlaC factor YlaD
MPDSSRRKKKAYQPIHEVSRKPVKLDSPRWLVPTMVTLLIVGLLYIVVFYVAGNQIPFMVSIGNLANIGIGFSLMAIGFFLSTKWR